MIRRARGKLLWLMLFSLHRKGSNPLGGASSSMIVSQGWGTGPWKLSILGQLREAIYRLAMAYQWGGRNHCEFDPRMETSSSNRNCTYIHLDISDTRKHPRKLLYFWVLWSTNRIAFDMLELEGTLKYQEQ